MCPRSTPFNFNFFLYVFLFLQEGARGENGTRVHAQRPLILLFCFYILFFAGGSSGRKWDTCPRSKLKLQWRIMNYWIKTSSFNT